MGQSNSQYDNIYKCNALCPVCMCRPNAVPNIAGRFFIINNRECQCNGCNSIFDKTLFYKSPFIIADVVTHAELLPNNNFDPEYSMPPLAQVMDRNMDLLSETNPTLETTPLVKAYLVEQKLN